MPKSEMTARRSGAAATGAGGRPTAYQPGVEESRAAFLAFLAAFRSFSVIVGFLSVSFLTTRLFMFLPFRLLF